MPPSARETNNEDVNGTTGHDPTYSATVGSIKLEPHRCQQCHRQYASNAKLLQHQRKKHQSNIPKPNNSHDQEGIDAPEKMIQSGNEVSSNYISDRFCFERSRQVD